MDHRRRPHRGGEQGRHGRQRRHSAVRLQLGAEPAQERQPSCRSGRNTARRSAITRSRFGKSPGTATSPSRTTRPASSSGRARTACTPGRPRSAWRTAYSCLAIIPSTGRRSSPPGDRPRCSPVVQGERRFLALPEPVQHAVLRGEIDRERGRGGEAGAARQAPGPRRLQGGRSRQGGDYLGVMKPVDINSEAVTSAAGHRGVLADAGRLLGQARGALRRPRRHERWPPAWNSRRTDAPEDKSDADQKVLGRRTFHNDSWEVTLLFDQGGKDANGLPMWRVRPDSTIKNVHVSHRDQDLGTPALKNGGVWFRLRQGAAVWPIAFEGTPVAVAIRSTPSADGSVQGRVVPEGHRRTRRSRWSWSRCSTRRTRRSPRSTKSRSPKSRTATPTGR